MLSRTKSEKEREDLLGLRDQAYLHFGQAIEMVRTSLQLTQSEFGAMLEGFSQTNVARYESGETEPPLEFWRKLGRGLGIGLSWAIAGEGDVYLPGWRGTAERERMQRYMRGLFATGRGENFAAAGYGPVAEYLGLLEEWRALRRERPYLQPGFDPTASRVRGKRKARAKKTLKG